MFSTKYLLNTTFRFLQLYIVSMHQNMFSNQRDVTPFELDGDNFDVLGIDLDVFGDLGSVDFLDNFTSDDWLPAPSKFSNTHPLYPNIDQLQIAPIGYHIKVLEGKPGKRNSLSFNTSKQFSISNEAAKVVSREQVATLCSKIMMIKPISSLPCTTSTNQSWRADKPCIILSENGTPSLQHITFAANDQGSLLFASVKEQRKKLRDILASRKGYIATFDDGHGFLIAGEKHMIPDLFYNLPLRSASPDFASVLAFTLLEHDGSRFCKAKTSFLFDLGATFETMDGSGTENDGKKRKSSTVALEDRSISRLKTGDCSCKFLIMKKLLACPDKTCFRDCVMRKLEEYKATYFRESYVYYDVFLAKLRRMGDGELRSVVQEMQGFLDALDISGAILFIGNYAFPF